MYVFGFGGAWFKQFMPNQPYGDFKPGEIRNLIFLWAIEQESKEDGLTGYSLHRLTGIPLTNIYRILEGFLENGLLEAEEKIEEGRAQKLYKITSKGENYFNKLKDEWASKVSFLQRIVPFCAPFPFPRRHHPKFREHIQRIEGKESALQFLKAYQESFTDKIYSMEITIQVLKDANKKINEAVETVKEQPDFSSKTFVDIVSSIYEDIESNVRSTIDRYRDHLSVS